MTRTPDTDDIRFQCKRTPSQRYHLTSISHALLVKPLPAACRLTAIFNTCHSGTVMDLPYVIRLQPAGFTQRTPLTRACKYTSQGKIKEPDLFSEASQSRLGAGADCIRGETGGAFKSLFGIAENAWDANRADGMTKETKTSAADVIQWAGCKDDQTVRGVQENADASARVRTQRKLERRPPRCHS